MPTAQLAHILQSLAPQLPRDADGLYDDDGYDHDALGRQLMWDDICEAFANALAPADRADFLAQCHQET